MLRLSKLTDYAVAVLVRLSRDAQEGETYQLTTRVQTSTGIAAATGVPEPTVAKVLKTLAGKGLVVSQRGARGGYRLIRPLNSIAVAEVIEAIDGPISITTCVDGAGGCEASGLCPMHGRWNPVNVAVREALLGISLADMQSTSPVLRERQPAALVSLPAE